MLVLRTEGLGADAAVVVTGDRSRYFYEAIFFLQIYLSQCLDCCVRNFCDSNLTPFTDRILAKRHLHFLSAIAKTLQIEVDAARSIVVVAAQHHRGGNCAARADLGVPAARGPHNAAGGSRDWNRRPQAAVATVVRFASFLLDVGSATSRCGAAPS